MFDLSASSQAFSDMDRQRFQLIQRLLDKLDSEAQACIVPGSPVPAGSIIVFPGSFNPPTNAHLAMLQQAQFFQKAQGAGPVYAALSTHTTDKEHVERPLLVDRVALLETVLQHYAPGVGIMLFNRGLYVEQAQSIRAAFPGVTRLTFLLGFDKIVQIFDPRYYTDRDAALKELFSLADILVAPRADAGGQALRALLAKPENQPYAHAVHLLPLDAMYREISSTHIRQDFTKYQHDVPPEVARFIHETGAYDKPLELPDGTERDRYGERIQAIHAITRASA